jgi:hypothetical protein
MHMNLLNTTLERAKALAARARSFVPARLSCATDGACELARAAFAGAILFGIAGAGLGARGGFSAFRIDSAAAGATVSVGWGYLWLALAAAGAAVGAVVGAGLTFAVNRWLRPQGLATSLLMVGALGGIAAGATWGSAVARERVVQVRAQQASARPPAAVAAPRVTVVNGPVRLDGTVDREMNLPLLAFIVLGATVVGTLAARGLVEPLHLGRQTAGPAPRAVPLPGGFPIA